MPHVSFGRPCDDIDVSLSSISLMNRFRGQKMYCMYSGLASGDWSFIFPGANF